MKKFIIYSFAVLPMLFWSMTFIWYKVVLEYIDPISVTFFRLMLASVILIIVTRFFIVKREKLQKKDYLYMLMLSFFEPFIYFLGESYGMKYVSPTIAAVIISTIPVVTPVFAFKILNERLNIFNIFGLILSFAGVITIIINPYSSSDFTVKGLLLLLLAVMGAVGYGITVKKLTAGYSSLTITKYQSIFGFFLFLPLFLFFDFQKTALDISTSISDGTFYNLSVTLLQMSFFAS
ncbi:MAG: DMT family transporter, partial [Candidatus Delongbacteria bacterium]